MKVTESPILHLHVVDELGVGGAQTHLVTILREAVARYPYQHSVISLFGNGPIGNQIRDLGLPVDILDLRPHFERRQFLKAAGKLERLFIRQRPALVEAHLTACG